MTTCRRITTIKITPMGKPRLSRADVWKRRAVVRRWYAYKDALRLQLRGYKLPERLRIDFCLPMPASWSRKKKEAMNGRPHRTKPDIDNLAKGFMDAVSEANAHVWELHARKIWCGQGAIIIYTRALSCQP